MSLSLGLEQLADGKHEIKKTWKECTFEIEMKSSILDILKLRSLLGIQVEISNR